MDLSEIKLWLAQDKVRQVVVLVAAVISLVTFSVVMKSCYENRIISEHETKVKAETLEKTSKSNDKAAEKRAEDAIANQNKDEARREAIEKETDSPPSDASVALGCERLRQAGYDTSRIPACSGR